MKLQENIEKSSQKVHMLEININFTQTKYKNYHKSASGSET